MAHIDDTLLLAIPEPALIACKGRVTHFNAAAGQLFPGLAEGAPLPEALPPRSEGAGLLLAGGQNWHFSVSPVGDSTLYLLHCARLDGMSRPQLDGTVRRLREHMAQLLLTVPLLAPHRDGAEDAPADPRLASMNRTLCQMLRLTDQLDLLRDMESGAFLFRPVTLDLAGLCREICSAAHFLLEQAGVSLRFDSPLTSLLVLGDSELLQKLLLELLVNAARAAGKGGQLTLTLARNDSRAVLTLSGPGQDDGRPLTQLLSGDPAESRIPQPGEGAGLGLVLAQRVTSLHQGTMMMERRDGVNTIVALPLAPKAAPLPVRTPKFGKGAGTDIGGIPLPLVVLSDLLPADAFAHLDVE